MDQDSSAKFIGSLTKFLQSLCNGYVEFQRGVELVGHIYLNIDTGEKVDYILHERVSKNDENSVSFVSNSFHAQPEDKKKAKEAASKPSAKGPNERLRDDDDDDDIVIVDHSHGMVGSTNTGSLSSRGVKRMASPGSDHRHAQRPRPSPSSAQHHNASSSHHHPYTSGNRQHSGRPSATVTSQGSSQNENLNIGEVKLEQISRDELLSLASHVGEGGGGSHPHASTSSSSSSSAVPRSQPQHSGMAGSSRGGAGGGDPPMWVKQEVPDEDDGGADGGWSQERDDSNSNSGSNLYPVMLHQSPAFPSSSMPGFSGPGGSGGPSGANPFSMPGTPQDMSGLDPSAPAAFLSPPGGDRYLPVSWPTTGGWGDLPLQAPRARSSSTFAMRRFRERVKQNSEQYRLYRERQNAWNKKWMAKNRRGGGRPSGSTPVAEQPGEMLP